MRSSRHAEPATPPRAGALVLGGLLLALGACQEPAPGDPGPGPRPPVATGRDLGPVATHLVLPTARLGLHLATDTASRMRGLSGVTELAPDEGMLFVYPEASAREFWMKGCLLSLDLLFLDEDGRVLSLHTLPVPAPGTSDADMPRAASGGPCRYVLEVNAGVAAALGLKVGDQLPVAAALAARRTP